MELKISTERESKRFSAFLAHKDNFRVIFSGIFGIGKTYFLKEFFSDNKEYFSIHLSPVNYSISTNEDIFKLVKYDILNELFVTHKSNIVKEEASLSVKWGMMLQEVNMVSVAQKIYKYFSLLNKGSGNEDLETALAVASELSEFTKGQDSSMSIINKLSKDLNRNDEALEFVKMMMNTFYLEEDFITGYITEKIDHNTRGVEQKKKSVLIVDDLDRIDPEHIFRLFNIFSSHMDYGKEGYNKFGFDKIIFVCDIHNIKSIFCSKYGIETDFNGYIDKFFSKDIYYFSNGENISNTINSILDSISFIPPYQSRVFEENLKNGPLFHLERGNGILPHILIQLAKNGLINMRRIKAIYGQQFKFTKKAFSMPNRRPVLNQDLIGLIALEILTWIAGDVESLERMLKKNRELRKVEKEQDINTDTISNYDLYFSQYFLPILLYGQGNLPPSHMLNEYNPPMSTYELRISETKVHRIDFTLHKDPGFFESRNYNGEIGYFYKIANKADMPRHLFDEVLYQSLKIMKDYLANESSQNLTLSLDDED